MPYLFQWTSQAYTQTYHNERVYAKHTNNFTKETLQCPYQVFLSLIILENLLQFNEKDYLQTHGTAMGTKMAVAFANIFMAKIEKEILRQSSIKPIFWKRFIDDIISVQDTSRNEIEEFLLKANNFHPTIKFTAEISETETTFLDKGSTRILSLTCEHTSSLQRHSKRASSKEKL